MWKYLSISTIFLMKYYLKFLAQRLSPTHILVFRNLLLTMASHRYWFFKLCMLFRLRPKVVLDWVWFELQFFPEKARTLYQIPLPLFPPSSVQVRFTADTGRHNFQRAFHFYNFIRSVCKFQQGDSIQVLDFGGGWGRIARFFLREISHNRIWISDCLGDAIDWLKKTENPCNIIKNDTRPPISGLTGNFDLIYAFSVFSHLNEQYFREWIDYFFTRLKPGGHIIITTRGAKFIQNLHRSYRTDPNQPLFEKLPNPNEIEARYQNGELQFYPTGGGGELSLDFYGETIIPKSYFELHFPNTFISFTESVSQVDQSVVVLKKQK